MDKANNTGDDEHGVRSKWREVSEFLPSCPAEASRSTFSTLMRVFPRYFDSPSLTILAAAAAFASMPTHSHVRKKGIKFFRDIFFASGTLDAWGIMRNDSMDSGVPELL